MIPLAALGPAISAALQLANAVVQKQGDADAMNVYIDRATAIKALFDPDTATHEAAYQQLYVEMQRLIATKKITPSLHYDGAPCLSIPLATLVQLMDAAS